MYIRTELALPMIKDLWNLSILFSTVRKFVCTLFQYRIGHVLLLENTSKYTPPRFVYVWSRCQSLSREFKSRVIAYCIVYQWFIVQATKSFSFRGHSISLWPWPFSITGTKIIVLCEYFIQRSIEETKVSARSLKASWRYKGFQLNAVSQVGRLKPA